MFWSEAGSAPRRKSICAFVSGVTFQTRLCTFQTRPRTFQLRLAGRLTGRGQQKRFPPLHTTGHCGRVLVGWGRLPLHKFHLRLSIPRRISNGTWHVSNTTGGTFPTRQVVHFKHDVLVGGVAPPHQQLHSRPSFRGYVSNATRYILNAFGRFNGSTLQTRVRLFL